jgi:Xaa-Pro aminopeptidase
MATLLLFGDTQSSPAMRHEVPVAIGDPFLFADVEGRRVVLTSSLERGRVAAALPDAELLDFFDFGLRELAQRGLSRKEADREIVSRVVDHLQIREALVPWNFPVSIADRLRKDDVIVTVDDDFVDTRRRVKTGTELAGVRAAQQAAHAATRAVAEMLAGAKPGPDGRLHLEGEQLTAEQLREQIRVTCAAHDATCPAGSLVSSVINGSGHDPGQGPLPAGLPIEIDVFPRDEVTGCWADMTRTFVVGSPTPEHAGLIAEQEGLVREALERAREATRPGVTGSELYAATCDLFEAAGYATQRTGQSGSTEEGFQFALGHGVGLEVHEPPGLGLSGSDPFVAGDVVAIEPGLWDNRVGGVRVEDLLLVTEAGCETLTRFAYDLAPSAPGGPVLAPEPPG